MVGRNWNIYSDTTVLPNLVQNVQVSILYLPCTDHVLRKFLLYFPKCYLRWDHLSCSIKVFFLAMLLKGGGRKYRANFFHLSCLWVSFRFTQCPTVVISIFSIHISPCLQISSRVLVNFWWRWSQVMPQKLCLVYFLLGALFLLLHYWLFLQNQIYSCD